MMQTKACIAGNIEKVNINSVEQYLGTNVKICLIGILYKFFFQQHFGQ